MTPTRADLERLIELPPQPEQPSHTGSDMAESGEIRRNYLSALEAWERVCNATIAARAALLTSEGPAQRPEMPTEGTCATCKHYWAVGSECWHPDIPFIGRCVRNAHSFGCTLHEPAPKEPQS